MRAALTLARRGLGTTWPNPTVGCVLVKDRHCVGRGVTQPGGRPHAEQMALVQAGERARGATAYVTLEPCAHHGQTPPCADALVHAGIGRAVIACRDPDPRVNGRGIERLGSAGIPVTEDICTDAARHLNAGFFSRTMLGRPHITLKMATTLDGRIAMASGESRWITSPLARRATHMLRSRSDAILVGHGTVRADDPMLDVRGFGQVPSPVRIVANASGTIDQSSRLLNSPDCGPVWILCGDGASTGTLPKNCQRTPVATGPQGIDLADAVTQLGRRGLTRVLCEGGASLAAGLINADLVDELVIFQAGKIIGAEGIAAIGPLCVTKLAATPQFRLANVQSIGPDSMSTWHRVSDPAP